MLNWWGIYFQSHSVCCWKDLVLEANPSSLPWESLQNYIVLHKSKKVRNMKYCSWQEIIFYNLFLYPKLYSTTFAHLIHMNQVIRPAYTEEERIVQYVNIRRWCHRGYVRNFAHHAWFLCVELQNCQPSLLTQLWIHEIEARHKNGTVQIKSFWKLNISN